MLQLPTTAEPTTHRRLRWATGLACAAGVLLALCGCRGVGHATTGLPRKHSVQADQLLVQSDVRLPKGHPLLQDLEELRNDISRMLDLPVQLQPVTVYLFADEQRYAQYLHATYPNLPPRRAYFVGTVHELAVYTFWGEKIQEDLRHEYTHGVLHACLKDVPLWLDEGLAEYFEGTEPPLGMNREYAARLTNLLASGWAPDLDRLETLESVAQMQKADYFEAWTWVHFLLHESDDTRTVLLDYLRELRTNPKPGRLSESLRAAVPHADERYLAYTTSLSRTLTTASAASRSPR